MNKSDLDHLRAIIDEYESLYKVPLMFRGETWVARRHYLGKLVESYGVLMTHCAADVNDGELK